MATDPNDPVLTNPTVALAVKSFRNMRSAALTPVARRLRDIMLKRHPNPPVPLVNSTTTDWTEVTIACPTLSKTTQLNKLAPPGRVVRETVGADVLLLLGGVLTFVGSGVTVLGAYGNFNNPETRPMVFGMGPPLIGIGFLFCLLRLFFCKPQRIPCYERFVAARNGKQKRHSNAVHPSEARLQNGMVQEAAAEKAKSDTLQVPGVEVPPQLESPRAGLRTLLPPLPRTPDPSPSPFTFSPSSGSRNLRRQLRSLPFQPDVENSLSRSKEP